MARFIQISALTLIGAGWLAMAGCSGSNDPATTTTGGTTSTSTGGTTSTTTGGTTSTTTGGTTSTTTGGTATTSTGGTATGTDMFTPLCAALTTAAGVAPTKGGVCTTADPALCYKTCGPQSVGFKSETCTSGAYVEQSGCSFKSDLDASCYKVPTTLSASCPAGTPQASMDCPGVPTCTPCSDASGTYLDSGGAPKVGWCVCPAPGAGGTSKWSCASATAWPCPQGKGC